MNIGFIGLGVMGFPMAGHLHKSKHNVAVFNRSSNKVEKWIKDYEGKAFKNIEDIAQFSDVIILCITKDQDVKEVLIKNQDFLIVMHHESFSQAVVPSGASRRYTSGGRRTAKLLERGGKTSCW